MSITTTAGTGSARRFSPLLWVACLTAVAVLALGITGTLSQFQASITNTNNNAQTGGADSFGFSESLVIGGVPQTPVCAAAGAGQAVNCDTINKNGALGEGPTPMAPGDTRVTTVRLQNTATEDGLSGNLTLTADSCVQTVPADSPNTRTGGIAGDLCDTLTVEVACAPTAPTFHVGPDTMTDFAGLHAVQASIAPGGYVDCTFTTAYPLENADPNLQGLATSQPMRWTFTQVETP